MIANVAEFDFRYFDRIARILRLILSAERFNPRIIALVGKVLSIPGQGAVSATQGSSAEAPTAHGPRVAPNNPAARAQQDQQAQPGQAAQPARPAQPGQAQRVNKTSQPGRVAPQPQAVAQPDPKPRTAPQERPAPPPLPSAQPNAPQPASESCYTASSQPLHEPGEGWLTIRAIVKSFKKRTVVRGVSLDVRRGEAVGLLGPNGAGKTTTFYMITGLIPADEGSIKIDGQDVTRLPMYRRARLGIGYLPQEASIFRGLTVEENILAVLETVEPNKKARHEQLDALLEEFRITRLRNSPSMRLSGGERRRVEIARALATRPSYMLLDEPFAGIDPIAVNDIRALVRHLTQRGIGVLITDHNVRETLDLVGRAYIIHDGSVLTHGTTHEIVNNDDVRRVYLGDDFRI